MSQDYSYCSTCGESGWVVVPHPEHVRNGMWVESRVNCQGLPVRVTAAVTCSCRRGGLVFDSACKQAGLHGRRPMSLTHYRGTIFQDPEGLEAWTREQDRKVLMAASVQADSLRVDAKQRGMAA